MLNHELRDGDIYSQSNMADDEPHVILYFDVNKVLYTAAAVRYGPRCTCAAPVY